MKDRCNYFVNKAKEDLEWAYSNIVRFLQYQRNRVEQGGITNGTLKNFWKPINAICQAGDVPINEKRITRGLPKVRRHANDRAPNIEEIQKICEYPDRRIKAIVYTMATSGIRLGSWDYLRWKDIQPIEQQGKIVAAKIIVYDGDAEEYFSFITNEAFLELQK
jgi:hypothetical protein